MYKVPKLWPSFKHFNFTRQMASHVVMYTLLLVGGLYITAIKKQNSENIDE